jgi:hypothetical protein
MRHGLPSRRLLGALVMLVVGLALPAPAAAFVRDFELLQPPGFVLNHAALPTTAIPVTCPNGKALVGIGADIHPVVSTGGPAINRLWPSDGRADQALVGSVNTNPERALWGTSGGVSCAAYTDTPPTTATGGPYLKDPVLVSSASVLSSIQLRIVDADCAGRRPISGGFWLVSARGRAANPPVNVVVDRAEIVGRQFRVVAHETQPTKARWSLEAYAVCVNYTDPFPGQVYVGPGPLMYTTTSQPTQGAGTVAGGCPGNWFAIGAGARVIGAGTTQSPPYKVAITDFHPASQTGSVRPSFWLATASDEQPPPPPRSLQPQRRFRLQVKTICAPLVAPSG